MKTYHLNEARAKFSKLFDFASAEHPQRVTRNGKEAVMIVSKKEWLTRAQSAPGLGALLVRHAHGKAISEPIETRQWKERRLGSNLK